MKYFLIFILALACSFLSTTRALAQDTISVNIGGAYKSYITGTDSAYLAFNNAPEYKNTDNQKQVKSANAKIKLFNQPGVFDSKDVIKSTFENQIFRSDSAKGLFIMGVNDAKKFYQSDYLGVPIFIQSFFGIGGLYTCMVASNVTPDPTRLITDDYSKFKDKNYETGYKNAALKIKRKKIWNDFIVGTCFKMVIIAAFFTL